MFTGIIESFGTLEKISEQDTNKTFVFSCDFISELKIDQSLSHNGVCLTVIAIDGKNYSVTAIKETLDKSNLGSLKKGEMVNLERCLRADGRFDGHIVQGHVDQTAICKEIKNLDGSFEFVFEYDVSYGNITVEKGSVCVNGVSLTVSQSKKNVFSVYIIPYTFENTTIKYLKIGDKVNIEFDIVGKYIKRMLEN
jgi:riboflavin synthase